MTSVQIVLPDSLFAALRKAVDEESRGWFCSSHARSPRHTRVPGQFRFCHEHHMDTNTIEELLNEEESTSLDFKRDQYPFVHATDDEKSELLKDLLAFANAWRRTEAFILIGVNEVRGGRSVPVGVSTHLDDSSLQEFVNSKVQRPVAFSYQTAEDGAEAIALYAMHRSEIAVILADIMMPVMDGTALIAATRRIDPGVKIVVASGNDANASAAKAGVPHFLAKPYTAEVLLRTLSNVLGKERRPGAMYDGDLRLSLAS